MIKNIFTMMKIRHKLLIVILSFFYLSSDGQSIPTITAPVTYNRIDTYNTVTSMYFPFDRPFFLKFPVPDKQKVGLATLFDVKRKKQILSNIDTIFQDTLGNEFLKLSYLRPGEKYKIVLSSLYPPPNIGDVIKALDSNRVQTAEKAYDEKAITYILNFNCRKCETDTFMKSPFADFKKYYDKRSVRKTDSIISKNQTSLDSMKKKKEDGDGLKIDDKLKIIKLCNADTNYIAILISKVSNCEPCKDTMLQFQKIINNRYGFINCMVSISSLTDVDAQAISYGYLSIDSVGHNFYFDTLKNNANIRLGNISKSIQILSDYLKVVDYANYQYRLSNKTYEQCIVKAVGDLEANYAMLAAYKVKADGYTKTIKKLQDSVDKIVNNFYGFRRPIAESGANTLVYDFQTRTGFAVKPDFGFLAYGNILFNTTEKNGKRNARFWGVSPFLGFHVNVRSLDTDVPFARIKGFGKHISFSGGALILPFNDNGQSGLINNTAIFTGMGYAFSHALRLTFGSVWFKRDDINPLISHKSVAAVPYIGASIDLRVRDIFNAFSNLFPKQ